MSEFNIYDRLSQVQNELKVPKNQKNNFGNYKYRSCEDILQIVKPLCIKKGLLLIITDSIEQLGDRYYIKATATVIGIVSLDKLSSEGWARESEIKKGMDSSQITGAASSYARKYALNGLFAIDDTKDADNDDNSKIDNKLNPKHITAINEIKTKAELVKFYNANKKELGNNANLKKLLADKKKEFRK